MVKIWMDGQSRLMKPGPRPRGTITFPVGQVAAVAEEAIIAETTEVPEVGVDLLDDSFEGP